MMPHFSLIEYTLRQYVYLGHEYSIYVPPSLRTLYFKQSDEIIGVQIIENVVKKNKTEEINSLVPIILKIKNEDKLHDDQLLIFLLAVCARFNLKQCVKMVADAYAAVSSICTDGLKLLMFVKFCNKVNIILNNKGYLSNIPSGFGNGFRKAMNKWYLDRDPLLTTQQIVRHNCYVGWSHKKVMNLIHIQSDNPSHQMFIIHTMCGMNKVEKLFGTKMKHVQIENKNETFENKQLKFIYNFLKQVNDMKKMDEITLKKEIELHRWGYQFEVIPQKMLKSPKILTSLVMHMPLKVLLDNTFFFAKHRLFRNESPDTGLWEFILRFNNTTQLQNSRIHPIESFIEYAKYSRTSVSIINIQKNILKKQENSKSELNDKPQVLETEEINDGSNSQVVNDSFNNLEIEEDTYQLTVEAEKEETKDQLINISNQLSSMNIDIEKQNSELNAKTELDKSQLEVDTADINSMPIIIKPPPRLVEQILTFLSEDLLRKTLEILKPSDHRIMIVYDNRESMININCVGTRLLYVYEAITLLILSLIFPEKLPNKPTIYGLNESGKKSLIEVDYKVPLSYASLQSILFKTIVSDNLNSTNGNNNSSINPLSIMNLAKGNKKEYDVFIFLGTNKMNLKSIKKTMKEYQAFLKKPVKIIVCCLNGKHAEQCNLKHENILFIAGFDKCVGKVINSFLNEEF